MQTQVLFITVKYTDTTKQKPCMSVMILKYFNKTTLFYGLLLAIHNPRYIIML